MPDLTMSATISRDLLGLSALQINDGTVYRISSESFLSGQMQWTRNQISSIYIDGAVTVARSRQIMNENFAVEVAGYNPANLKLALTQNYFQANMAALIAAMSQDTLTLDLLVGPSGDQVHYTYTGEAADVQVAWTTPRFAAMRGLVTFTMPRQPVPVAGGV
jgi:hypothetical protein